ncbi:MAG: RNA polymerase sigma factor [Proteobacteria bacterium]|nr:RNA polymerase sigma factor [Pseudomonadota bacterium]MBU1715136.1 RNA polymerase sigma factor [Pseudomonadota bacterium]
MDNVINIPRENCRESAIETLLEPHLQYLYRLAFRLTGKSHDAEDLLHDVLVKVFAKQRMLAGIENLRPWLTTTLSRTFIDLKRKENRSLLRLFKPATDDNSISELDAIASPRPGPEKESSRFQDKQIIAAALSRLNAEQKTVCVLHDMEGYTLQELEEILATPIGTLKSRLHRAHATLKNYLQKNGTFPAYDSFSN